MIHLYPIKFAFGSSVPSHIPIEDITHYQKHLSKLLHKRLSVRADLKKKFKTIPIDEQAGQPALVFVKRFKDVLSKSYKILRKNTFIRRDDLVVIDVRGIIRSLNLLSLTTEIESIVDKDPKTNDSIRFVLIVETVAEKRVLNPILPAIRNKKVCVIDSDRRVLFGDGHLGMKSDFPAGSTNENLIERMKYKLIRRVGHFKRPINGQHALCNQFFYDGTIFPSIYLPRVILCH